MPTGAAKLCIPDIDSYTSSGTSQMFYVGKGCSNQQCQSNRFTFWVNCQDMSFTDNWKAGGECTCYRIKGYAVYYSKVITLYAGVYESFNACASQCPAACANRILSDRALGIAMIAGAVD
jgi:hypothetical protein